MKHFFVLTFLLLVIQFERPVFGEELDVYATVGKIVELPATKIDGQLVNCEAIFHGTVNEEIYKIFPDRDGSSINHMGYFENSCRFTFSQFPAGHSGKWTVKTIYNKDDSENMKEEKFIVYETEMVDGLPTKTVNVQEGQYVILYMKETDTSKTSNCELTTNTMKYNLKNLPKDNNKINLFGECGVRMFIDNNEDSTLSISSVSGYFKKIAEFRIYVSKKNSDNSPRQHYDQWNQGTINHIFRVSSGIENIYCEIQRPDGVIIPLKTSDCTYTVGIVSSSHAGVWIARYGLKYSMELVEEYYNIDVWDSEKINVTVVKDNNDNSIHMLCEVAVNHLGQCMFEKPNGTVIVLPAAVGNDNYEYFGIGYQNIPTNQKAQCGITIRKPDFNDFGVWKCLMRVDNQKTISALINVYSSSKKIEQRQLKISNEPTYAKRGDDFSIKCTVDTQLDYCWMLSPNGTIYSVTKDGNQKNSLKYSGDGLSLGVCGAIVKNADETHSGDWSCHLGVHQHAEVMSIVHVKITDSYLIPSVRKIDNGNGEETTELLCRVFPNAEAEIDYCRWVRPSRTGLKQNDLTKYKIKQNKNNCTLQFKYGDIAEIGYWKCYARLTSGSDEEYHANVYYSPLMTKSSYLSYRSFTFNFLIFGLLFCFFAVTILLFHKKRQAKTINPPLPFKLPTYFQACNSQKKIHPEKDNIKS